MKVLCLLTTCLDPQNRMSSKGELRVQQYIEGLNLFFSNMPFFDDNGIDVAITDNSCEELPSYVMELLPGNVRSICKNRNCGAINKGVGLIEQWKDCANIIKDYDYLIHFEPRQLLQNISMFENFLQNPTNLFTLNYASKHFNTGLFMIKVNILLTYISNVDTNIMEKNNISIENHLENYMKDKGYRLSEKMGLIWIDGNTKYIF